MRVLEQEGSHRNQLGMGPLVWKYQAQLLWISNTQLIEIVKLGAHIRATFSKNMPTL
jgi:hypothetical protein